MNFIHLYARVLKLLGDESRLGWMLAIANMSLAAAQFAEVVPEVGLEQVRDVLFAYSSPELYELLVLRQGWSTDDYSRFVADGIAAAVLPPHLR